jgi:hypothetical protein
MKLIVKIVKINSYQRIPPKNEVIKAPPSSCWPTSQIKKKFSFSTCWLNKLLGSGEDKSLQVLPYLVELAPHAKRPRYKISECISRSFPF